jgi:hypothetical protein
VKSFPGFCESENARMQDPFFICIFCTVFKWKKKLVALYKQAKDLSGPKQKQSFLATFFIEKLLCNLDIFENAQPNETDLMKLTK